VSGSDLASPRQRHYGRRAFLGVVATGVSALWWGDAAWRGAGNLFSLPSTLQAALPAPGTGWRIYSVNPPMPTFDRRSWRLRIEGLVERPLELTYDELLALPRSEQVSDFHCVTGWSVPDVRWTGVRFAELLAQARPSPAARALSFVSMERPYVDSLTLDQASRPDAMLAYAMDGRPLTRPHGAPVRVVMPAMYGYKGVKWVERIVVEDRPTDGYWEQRGYDRNAWVGHSNGH
jgi:DMSO/TMAO reductase YedYZ molybdopterin-dependent catalytic subunit